MARHWFGEPAGVSPCRFESCPLRKQSKPFMGFEVAFRSGMWRESDLLNSERAKSERGNAFGQLFESCPLRIEILKRETSNKVEFAKANLMRMQRILCEYNEKRI